MTKRASVFLAILLFLSHLAYSQWQWLNPQPSGYNCSKIVFINRDTGFILNNNGDLLTTTDQGAHWDVKQNFPYGRVMDLRDSTVVIANNTNGVNVSRDNGNSWQFKAANFTNLIEMIDIVSRDTIFMASTNGYLYRSDDGGNSWKTFYLARRILSIEFVNSRVGYLGGYSNYIWKTEDGGTTLKEVMNVNSYPSEARTMHFLNADTGFVFREHRDLLSTTDGGATWKITNPFSDYIYSIQFINATTGFATGNHGIAYRTDNGGQTWTSIHPAFMNYDGFDLNSICFLDTHTGFAVGQRGRILKTTDGGTIWKAYSPTYIPVTDLSVPATSISYAAIASNIYKTTDAGGSWQPLAFTAKNQFGEQVIFTNLCFLNADTGFAMTNNDARLHKTTDGGTTWKTIQPHPRYGYDQINGMQFFGKQTAYMLLYWYGNCSIVKTTDMGESWTQVWEPRDQGEIINKLYLVNEKTGYGVDYDRLLKTDDSVKTFQQLWEDERITDLTFLNPAKGFVTGENGMLKMTKDSGKTWTDLTIPSQFAYDDLYSIRFFNDQVGYITAENGVILRTINSGESWHRYGNSPYSMHVIRLSPDSTVYIGGDNGSILKNAVADCTQEMYGTVYGTGDCKYIFSGNVTAALLDADSITFQYGTNEYDKEFAATPSTVSNAQSQVTGAMWDWKAGAIYKVRLKMKFKGAYRYSNPLVFYAPTTPPTPVIQSSSGTSMCEGDSVVLTSSGFGGLQWLLNGIRINEGTGHTYTARSTGKYQVIRTVSCVTSDTGSITITAKPLPPTPAITIANNILSSSAADGNQWYLDSVEIPGATAATYKPVASGRYTVRVTKDNCKSALSPAFIFEVTSTDDPALERALRVGPNPLQDQLYIQYNGNEGRLLLQITDIRGRQLTQQTINNNITVDMRSYGAGVYVINITNPRTGTKWRKVVVKE